MKTKHFINKLSDEKIVGAIRAAERETSGEIRVFVSHKIIADPVAAAQEHFVKLKMNRTRERNGVLIFVAPESHNFAIIGDAAVHAKCGESFWSQVAAEMTEHFKRSAWTDGVVHAIRKAGDLLTQHFPHRGGDSNELSDKIERD